MKDLRRSWHCRRLFFRYLREQEKNKAITPTPIKSIEVESNSVTEVKKPLNKKVVVITVSVICTIIIGIVLLSVFTSPKYTHKCVFSTYGTSTSTCQSIGETTYKCIYANDSDIKCNKAKVVKDTACAPCVYKVKSTVYDKINQSKYISACAYCHKEKEEIVNHSTTQYKDKIGNWGVIGVANSDVEKKSGEYKFECLLYTTEKIKAATNTKYYIILKLYDTNEDWYANYYMRGHILTSGRYLHYFKIKDYTHRVKYNDHRWEISSIAPNNATELHYYD